MSEIETRLRSSYAAEAPPAPDVVSLFEGARRRGRGIRRRRRAVAAVGSFAAAAAVVVVAHAASAPSVHDAPSRPPAAPEPAGPVLTVYRFSTSSGGTRIVSFLDTRGRWCVGESSQSTVRLSQGSYGCASAGLATGATGFGRVATTTDAFDYDGMSRWMQGVASADVARVTVALRDGSTRIARLVRDDAGVVFAARIAPLSNPAFYRAYDDHGRLLAQLRVPTSHPGDPFVDWRQQHDSGVTG